jgi:hypothetical protein
VDHSDQVGVRCMQWWEVVSFVGLGTNLQYDHSMMGGAQGSFLPSRIPTIDPQSLERMRYRYHFG